LSTFASCGPSSTAVFMAKHPRLLREQLLVKCAKSASRAALGSPAASARRTFVAQVQVAAQGGQEQRALVLPGLVDASLLQTHRLHQVRHRGSLVPAIPEDVDGRVEGLVDLEGAGRAMREAGGDS
jgi:hypothetical protein